MSSPIGPQEVMADVDLLALEPDPKSRMGASRFIGHSPSAGRAIVVIAYRDLDGCLLYTSDAADERSSVDLGGRRLINKKKKKQCIIPECCEN